jgi:hypothetical protein
MKRIICTFLVAKAIIYKNRDSLTMYAICSIIEYMEVL